MNPADPVTLAEALLQLQRDDAGARGTITYLQGRDERTTVTYRQLHDRARQLLYHLQRTGAAPGSRMIIASSDNQQLLEAFWACQLGGITAVPIAVSFNPMGKEKFFSVYEALEDAFVFTDRKALQGYESFANDQQGNTLRLLTSMRPRTVNASTLTALDEAGEPHAANAEDIALIQFSSGTTGSPKGVQLSHRNLLTNINSIISGAELTRSDSYLSWMPLTHDMGLIGFHLTPLILGGNQHLMPSMLFARQPLLWLSLASELAVSVLASPSFGYQHYLKAFRKTPEQDLDLSNVRLIFNGAEAIAIDVVERFCDALKPALLDRKAIFPVYGLAEASLAVTFPEVHVPPLVLTVDRSRLAVGDRVQLDDIPEQRRRAIVGVGTAIKDCEYRIVDDEGAAVPEGVVGHIEIRGGNVTRGYYGSPAVRPDDEWLATGDLGFEHGQLFIVGRSKDTILINGVTYHATDLETICERAAALPAGQVVCSSHQEGATERLLVFVQYKGEFTGFLPTIEVLRKHLLQQVGLHAEFVIPVRSIPKTSSGKVRRQALQADFDAGAFVDELNSLNELLGAADAARSRTVRSRLELLLLDICRESITEAEVSVEDDLFDLGVSSLELAAICEEIDAHFPGRLELSDFLEHTSIAALAEHLATSEDPADPGPGA